MEGIVGALYGYLFSLVDMSRPCADFRTECISIPITYSYQSLATCVDPEEVMQDPRR